MAGLPREILKWLQSLDLSYSVKNPKRDFASGFLFAEILSKYKPEVVKMHAFDNASELNRKESNWEHLSRLFEKLNLPISKSDWEPVMHVAPEAASTLLKRLFTLLTGKKVNEAPPSNKIEAPPFAHPTASHLLRDSQLQRIQDKPTRDQNSYSVLARHTQTLKFEKTKPGRMSVPRKTTKSKETSTKKVEEQPEEPITIIPVNVNPMEKSLRTSKALALNKNDKSAFKGNTEPNFAKFKSMSEILSESVLETIHNPSFKALRTEEFKDVEHGEELTKKFFSEINSFGKEFVSACLKNMEAKASMICDVSIKASQEFGVFAEYFVRLLADIPADFASKDGLSSFLEGVGKSMSLNDSAATEQLFTEYFLSPLSELIFEQPHKLSVVVPLVYSFSFNSEIARINYLTSLLEDLDDHSAIIRMISQLTCFDQEYLEDLHDYYLFYIRIGLDHSSSKVRTSALSALGHIASLNTGVVRPLFSKLYKLKKDSWWEVRAQLLRICGIVRSPELNQLVFSLFHPSEVPNVLRIGVVYLASTLQNVDGLCEVYIKCLLRLPSSILTQVLDPKETAPTPCVMGFDTQTYHLTGAPSYWEPLTVAKSLSAYIQTNELESLEQPHIQILQACLNNSLENEDWLEVFETLKDYLFVGLCDTDICEGAIRILKVFFTAEKLMNYLFEHSEETLIKSLNLLLTSETDKQCIEATIGFLKSLYWEAQTEALREFVFRVVKNFAEKYPVVFERSELVEVINEMIRHRRGDIFKEFLTD